MKTLNSVKLASRGYYSLTVLDKGGNRVEEKCSKTPTQNTITYAGAYYSLIQSNIFGNIVAGVGTGTVETTRASIALNQEVNGRSGIASASREGNEFDNLDGTSTVTLTREFVFPLGDKVGTFSEIGLYSSTSTSAVFIAGQLIKDEFGNPTTITLVADEQLVVTYTLEWVVPNTSSLLGVGTVQDANLNNYDYEIWAQPYFGEYAPGRTSHATKYGNLSGVKMSIRFADGLSGTSLYSSASVIKDGGDSITHDGSGLVTINTVLLSYAPSDFTSTDMVYIIPYGDGTTGHSGFNVVDTTKTLVGESSAGWGQTPIVIKFLQPITKTSNDTFTIQAQYTLQV